MSQSSPEAATVSAENSPAMAPSLLPGMMVPSGVPVDAAGVPAGEACPPPLVWQEVLNTFHAESEPWELNRGSRLLYGRAWGSGPPLYLLNGFVGTAELYALLAYLLRDSFRCVLFDTTSSPNSRGTQSTIHDYADDMLAVADQQGHSSFGVFAPSIGAAVALQGALQQPGRITGLVLQHGFARRKLSWTERLLARWFRRSGRTLSTLPWRRRVQELNHRRWFPPFDGTRFEFLVESTGKIPLSDLSQKALAIHAVDLEDQLSQIKSPVMLVRTEGQGPLETAGHEVLEKGLPNVHVEWLHSTGLHPYLTHPHRLAKLIKTFYLGSPAPQPH
jgi:pimeloyl-ACP methyl ester carboxylesterase